MSDYFFLFLRLFFFDFPPRTTHQKKRNDNDDDDENDVVIKSASEVSTALSFNLHLPHLFRKRRRENCRCVDTRPRIWHREHAFLFVHNHWYFQESFGGLFVLL